MSGENSQELVTDLVEESTDSNSNSQERSLLVTDLGDQNQRLGKQLAEAEEAALDLRAQVLVCLMLNLAGIVDDGLGK